ncbi:sigma-54-dependent Fis family transcriptional regulator [Neisseria sp. 83E34]|uniref:sigma-54-dependent Fis family transcriptional regulator n=1 Tax=Neisseria sp. 83E34 TaxID=1692264 RepID=UPI0006CE79B3|nr:sigma-54-dependent Fis family transcriptional regulator [Neisseria sp. 83E34]KPN72199.1 Fis family transcriptional regulator [Neisseria sp. 83E34]
MPLQQPRQIANQDLIDRIRFDVENGKIWFCEQRMLLSHAYALWRLREDLVESLGKERAKRFFMRYGYYAGVQDAEIAKKVRPSSDPTEAFLVGPQLHTVRGMVKVTPVTLDIDIEQGRFYGEFAWEDSFEVSYHKKKNGISQEPVCWSLLGYASGYSSYFMGKQIAFTETQCEAMGHTHCHIIGKPVEEWDETTDLERSMLPDPVEEELFSLRSELDELKHRKHNDLLEQDSLFDAVGESPAFRHVCEMLNKASKSKVAVLLEGETGVGKEAFAKGLHAGSDRSNQPFVAINCACIPPELIEAELFGVERGAFTGAAQSKAGKFERADKGTIFLDEVAELSPRAQAALLRVLQEGELERVGGTQVRKVDVRLVAATNESLADAVAAGKFRADLYYRLNTFPVYIPPLRERQQDIPILIKYFLDKYSAIYQKKILGISDQGRELLLKHRWPGNIRELENVIERGIILTEHNHFVEAQNLFPHFTPGSDYFSIAGDALSASMDANRKNAYIGQLLEQGFDLEHWVADILQEAVRRSGGNISEAARKLNISRATLAYQLKKYSLNVE